MSRPDDQRPCPCRCATRAICPSPDDGSQCACNPRGRGRGHKGSNALLDRVMERQKAAMLARRSSAFAQAEEARRAAARPATVPETE